MKVNADFSHRVVITPKDYQWLDSPVVGVERMMLDRIGAETGHATSLVRYAPNSSFPTHVHDGGEEILVLSGVFSDEQGDYPQGSYLRNPIGSHHQPKIGKEGALIFVKLHQFSTDDKDQINLNTTAQAWLPGVIDGLSVMPLHSFETTHTALVKWQPNTQFQLHSHFGGEEILVLEGTFYDEHGEYPKGTWIRSPHLSRHHPYTKDDGAVIYVKTGHLFIE